jgi:hypothetical protein
METVSMNLYMPILRIIDYKIGAKNITNNHIKNITHHFFGALSAHLAPKGALTAQTSAKALEKRRR